MLTYRSQFCSESIKTLYGISINQPTSEVINFRLMIENLLINLENNLLIFIKINVIDILS